MPLSRPVCDCGHAFEPDPRWFHLSQCAYRLSFRLPTTTPSRFGDGRLFDNSDGLTPQSSIVRWAKALHDADDRMRRDDRRYRGIPAMRAAYRRRRRYW
jgi:hypothetical protein